jgi:putative glutamine amidotransferase
MSTPAKIFICQYSPTADLENYADALAAAGMEPVLSPDLSLCEGCDGLLLPGGGDSDPVLYGQENYSCIGVDDDRDRQELDTFHAFLAAKKPVLAICRGHQLVNIALGGDLIQDLPTAEDHVPVEKGVDRHHAISIEAGSFLTDLYGAETTVNSSHHQGVGDLAGGLRIIAHAPDGVVEAMEHEKFPIWCVQFHPERMQGKWARDDVADGGAIFRAFRAMVEEHKA